MSPMYQDMIVDPAEIFEYEAVLDSLVDLTGTALDPDRYALHGKTNNLFDELEPLITQIQKGLSGYQKGIDIYNHLENVTKLLASGKLYQASIAGRKFESDLYDKKLLNVSDREQGNAATKISNMVNEIEEYVLANNITESTYADMPEVPASMLPSDFDALAINDERIANNINAVSMPQYVIDSTSVMSDATREEVENFIKARTPQPLALLSSEARRELANFAKDEFYFNQGYGLEGDDQQLRQMAQLSLALQAERLAYEPNATSLGSADFFRGISSADLELATDSATIDSWENPNDYVRFSVNGEYTGFSVKRSGSGGGPADTNKTYILRDDATGQLFIYKKELNKEARDAEVATSELMRGLDVLGASYVVPHRTEEDVLVSTFAGSNVNIDPATAVASGSFMYPNESSDIVVNRMASDALLAYGNFQQNMAVGLLDAVINNLDRHAGNWMWANDTPNAADKNGMIIMPIDHGLGMAFEADPDYGDLVDPMDYIFNDAAGAGSKMNLANRLADTMGEEMYTVLAKMSAQQALQYIEALYPAGVNPSMDILVGRLNQILNYRG